MPTTRQTSGERERGQTSKISGSRFSDLANPQDGMQARLNGLTRVLEIIPRRNRPLVAGGSDVVEYTGEDDPRGAEALSCRG